MEEPDFEFWAAVARDATPTDRDNLDCDDPMQGDYHREGTLLDCPTCIRARRRLAAGGTL